jgi:hypothetical protein
VAGGSINKDLIKSQVGRKRVAPVPVEIDRMGVWVSLPTRMNAGTVMLMKTGRIAQRTIFLDGNHRHAPAAVVGNQDEAPLLVDDQMAGRRSASPCLIQRLQSSGGLLDRESLDRSGLVPSNDGGFTNTVQEASRRVQSQKGWIARRGGQLSGRQFTRRRIHPGEINPQAVSIRIRADIHQQVFSSDRIGHDDF